MNTTTVWILLLASNPACVFLGYLWGRVTRATVEIAESAVDNQANPGEPTPQIVESKAQTKAMRIMAVAMVTIGLATALTGFVLTRNQDRIVGCVVGYSNAMSDTLKDRLGPQQRATEALDRIMEALAEGIETPTPKASERVRTAINEYVEMRTEAKKTSAQNPYPDAPRDACSELK